MTTMHQDAYEVIAHDFMTRKGLGRMRPFDREDLEDQECTYLYYQLPQGVLELEVFYDAKKDDWEVSVTQFPIAL